MSGTILGAQVKHDDVIPGINIQWPWSELILQGKKTIETRSYPIPKKHIGKPLAIIETPGPKGKKEAGIEKARIVGVVIFSGDKQYQSKSSWAADKKYHLVEENDHQYFFSKLKPKWGWTVSEVKRFKTVLPAPTSRGIVFASECRLK